MLLQSGWWIGVKINPRFFFIPKAKKSSLSFIVGKQLQVKAEADVVPCDYSSQRSGSAPHPLLQSWPAPKSCTFSSIHIFVMTFYVASICQKRKLCFLSVSGSGSDQNLTYLQVFIPPECLALHLTLSSRAVWLWRAANLCLLTSLCFDCSCSLTAATTTVPKTQNVMHDDLMVNTQASMWIKGVNALVFHHTLQIVCLKREHWR